MGSLSPAESDAAIPELVRASFAHALEADDVYLYAAAAPPLRLDDDPKGFPQHAHLVPQLAEKPAVPPKTPDLRTRRERDVLEGPEYGKGEKILQLEQDGLDYALIHNLHALFPEHMMAVPIFGERPFRPQTSDLTEQDLYVAWRVVNAYAQDGRTETVMFFNGGPLAGASQPHLHMQFCPFQYGMAPAPEALARSLPEDELSASPAAGTGADGPPRPAPRLPLPWTQFCLPLPRLRSSEDGSASSGNATLSSAELFATYQRLLRTAREYVDSLAATGDTATISNGSHADAASPYNNGTSSTDTPSTATEANRARVPPAGPKRNSYNLFLTSRHMHLVPRTDRLVSIPRTPQAHPSPTPGDLDRASWTNGAPDPAPLRISLNGLVYLGYWHVASREDWELVRSAGVGEVLTRAAYVNEEYGEERRK